ncbi:hypothetical protein EJ04DRAFT_528953 [Polyplosphaeria fusca]|uniref:Uncharacterized protein n=1 Tax=Polyplosphaeria fusca TaxID=682080 RepID=A0A9P4QIQ0_9PLEO|nr:hypothetical protein EJ04DRAFT_528953 [Polyplosphaeria fusca]
MAPVNPMRSCVQKQQQARKAKGPFLDSSSSPSADESNTDEPGEVESGAYDKRNLEAANQRGSAPKAAEFGFSEQDMHHPADADLAEDMLESFDNVATGSESDSDALFVSPQSKKRAAVSLSKSVSRTILSAPQPSDNWTGIRKKMNESDWQQKLTQEDFKTILAGSPHTAEYKRCKARWAHPEFEADADKAIRESIEELHAAEPDHSTHKYPTHPTAEYLKTLTPKEYLKLLCGGELPSIPSLPKPEDDVYARTDQWEMLAKVWGGRTKEEVLRNHRKHIANQEGQGVSLEPAGIRPADLAGAEDDVDSVLGGSP